MAQYTLKGINSDTDTCENCGKTNLKKVMWLAPLDADGNEIGSVMPMGTTCGAKALGFRGLFSSVEQVAQVADLSAKKAQAIERAKAMAVEFEDEIAIIKTGNDYQPVRSKAFDANPNRYGMPVEWVS